MWKQRSKFVVPVMVIVAIAAIFMLTKYYDEVTTYNKVIITIAATLFSGVIAALLFPTNEHKIDEKKEVEPKK